MIWYKTRKINITYRLSKRRQRCKTDSSTVSFTSLSVGGRLFHGFTTRSVKKVCHTPLVGLHWGLNSLYACPRVVVVRLLSKNHYNLQTPIQKLFCSRLLNRNSSDQAFVSVRHMINTSCQTISGHFLPLHVLDLVTRQEYGQRTVVSEHVRFGRMFAGVYCRRGDEPEWSHWNWSPFT